MTKPCPIIVALCRYRQHDPPRDFDCSCAESTDLPAHTPTTQQHISKQRPYCYLMVADVRNVEDSVARAIPLAADLCTTATALILECKGIYDSEKVCKFPGLIWVGWHLYAHQYTETANDQQQRNNDADEDVAYAADCSSSSHSTDLEFTTDPASWQHVAAPSADGQV